MNTMLADASELEDRESGIESMARLKKFANITNTFAKLFRIPVSDQPVNIYRLN